MLDALREVAGWVKQHFWAKTDNIILRAGQYLRVGNSQLKDDKLGIGTTAPDANLEIYGSDAKVLIGQQNNAGTVGYEFKHARNVKNAIVSVARGSWGRGQLYFIQDIAADNDSYELSDAVMAFVNGNVGIGTPSPMGKLHIKHDGTTTLQIEDSSGAASSRIQFSNGSVYHQFRYDWAANALQWINNFVTQITVLANGRVGIGTTSPASKLDVNGDAIIRDNLRAHRGVLSHGFELADDAIIDLFATHNVAREGFILVYCGQQESCAVISYRANGGPWCTALANSGNPVATGTTTLTAGTSNGVDGRLNVAALADGSLIIKNRLGTTRRFGVLIVG